LFTNVSYLQEKIYNESKQDLDQLIDYSIQTGASYAPGRFASFQLGWTDFLNYPIAGVGGAIKLRNVEKQGGYVYAINGFANIMTHYGSIGIILFFYLIFTSGKWLSRTYKFSGYFIFPALILIISFGFGIIEAPIIFTFLLVSVFLNKPIQRKINGTFKINTKIKEKNINKLKNLNETI
jgi:hypothetical protein